MQKSQPMAERILRILREADGSERKPRGSVPAPQHQTANLLPPEKASMGMGLSGAQRLREPAYVVNKKPVQWIRREEGLPQQSPGLQTPAQFAQSQE